MATRIFGPSKGNRRPTQVAPSKTPTKRPVAQKGGGGNKTAGSPEPTAETTPTVSVSPSGEVTTENFGPSPAEQRQARRAKRQAVESRRRVQKVRTYVKERDKELSPKREVQISKGFLERQESPKPVTVKAHERPHPSEPKKTIPVAEHQRALPGVAKGYTKAEREVLAETGEKPPQPKGPELKGTQQEREAARARVRAAKREVRESRPSIEAELGPEQRKFVMGVARETGLRPATIAAQARAEEGSGEQTEAEQTHNFLNMGPGIRYASLKEGIDATANNYNTSHFYEGVRATRGQSAQAQAHAIAESPWGTGPLIEQTLSEVKETPGDPKAKARLKAAVKEAKELGLKVSPTGVQSPGRAPKQVVTRYKQARSAMSELDKLNNEGRLPYVWGGHHGNKDSFDCSGAVSYVLEKLKVLPKGGALVSGDMGSVLAPGPGALTVFYNGEHTFIYDAVKKEFWGTSQSNVEGGAGYFPNEVGEAEVQGGNSAGAYQVGHIPGLGKKQALQMGGALGGLTTTGGSSSSSAIPGMELSSGGTTATIVEGEGVKKNGKPGFSKKPIELTPLQQLRRRVRKLKNLGVDVEGPFQRNREPTESESSQSLKDQLAALEKRYSIGAV